MQILLVEDEKDVRDYLAQALAPQGYHVSICSTHDEFVTALSQQTIETPDVLILDRLLGQNDSTKLLARIRERWPHVAVLVLSAIGSPQEKSQVIDLGADDYISKPFSIEELSSRIRALLRRRSSPSERLSAGNTHINLLSQAVEVESRRVDLSRKEYLVLVTLMKTSGRVFNKFQLLDSVWDINADVESNVVEVTVRNLRRKLEEAKSTIHILSKRNVGYWIES